MLSACYHEKTGSAAGIMSIGGLVLQKLHVAVLMGGISRERKISLSTGRQILAALDRFKYTPVGVDTAFLSPGCAPEQPEADLEPLDIGRWAAGSQRPDVAFIALHGRGGEDGTIQGLLELLGIPYTGSGVLASALAMDKIATKRLLRSEGIAVAEDIIISRLQRDGTYDMAAVVAERLGYPVVVKPNREGSTIGCSIVRREEDLARAVDDALQYDSDVLVEKYIVGTEITAGLLGNEEPEVLPLIEIVPKSGFYDYEAKYALGGSQHVIPARISNEAAERARCYARRTHQILGCRGMSRVDMIVAEDQPYVLEVNTIPGMTPTSLLPEAAQAAGVSFSELLDRIIQSALASGVS